MSRTLNGQILIDDQGNFNEGLWLMNLLQLHDHYKNEESNMVIDKEEHDIRKNN